MKSLADYIHKRKLKFGLYASAGNMTCMNRTGSLGHEDKDAKTFADCEVDLIKYEDCWNDHKPAKERF